MVEASSSRAARRNTMCEPGISTQGIGILKFRRAEEKMKQEVDLSVDEICHEIDGEMRLAPLSHCLSQEAEFVCACSAEEPAYEPLDLGGAFLRQTEQQSVSRSRSRIE